MALATSPLNRYRIYEKTPWNIFWPWNLLFYCKYCLELCYVKNYKSKRLQWADWYSVSMWLVFCVDHPLRPLHRSLHYLKWNALIEYFFPLQNINLEKIGKEREIVSFNLTSFKYMKLSDGLTSSGRVCTKTFLCRSGNVHQKITPNW